MFGVQRELDKVVDICLLFAYNERLQISCR